jgi:hypothetical protein
MRIIKVSTILRWFISVVFYSKVILKTHPYTYTSFPGYYFRLCQQAIIRPFFIKTHPVEDKYYHQAMPTASNLSRLCSVGMKHQHFVLASTLLSLVPRPEGLTCFCCCAVNRSSFDGTKESANSSICSGTPATVITFLHVWQSARWTD